MKLLYVMKYMYMKLIKYHLILYICFFAIHSDLPGHVERSTGGIKAVCDLRVQGRRRPGGPKMSWTELVKKDRIEWRLDAADPLDKVNWRLAVRSARCAASQLPGLGPTDGDSAPSPAR